MKKKLVMLLLSSTAIAANSFAETVYIEGKAVDPKIIQKDIDQFKKSSPMAAQQVNNPQFKKSFLQSVGMQQALLKEGDSQHLDKSAAYQQRLQDIKPMIYAQMLQEKITISDAEVKAKYEQMKQEALKKQYLVSHVLVKDEKTAKDIVAQLNHGAKIADLAKKHSTDPGTKANGGNLGWSNCDHYAPEFTAAIKSLQKGKFTTTPVHTQFGWHVILLSDVKTPASSTIPAYDNKEKEQIKQQLEQTEKPKKFFDGIKTKYKIEVK